MRFHRFVNALALVALAFCAGCRTAQGAQADGDDTACRMREVARRVLVADDGRALYVEPQTFASNGRQALLAGWPAIVWRPDRDSNWVLQRVDSVFGVVVAPGKPARIVPRPAGITDTIDGVQAVANRDGSWTVIWMEVDSVTRETLYFHVLRMRAARLLPNGRWGSAPEELPLPPDVQQWQYRTAGRPVMAGDSVVWGVVARMTQQFPRAFLYVRYAGRWTVEQLPTSRFSHVIPGWSPGSGLVLAALRPDTTVRSDNNSLFLYTNHDGWRVAQRIVLGGTEPVYAPQWAHTPDGLVLGWTRPAGAGRGQPVFTAALVGDSVSSVRPSFGQSYMVPSFIAGPRGAALWLTQDVVDDGMIARVTMVRGGRLDTLGRVVPRGDRLTFTRFTAFRDVAAGNLMLVGPEMAPIGGSLPPLFSRLVEAHIDCSGVER